VFTTGVAYDPMQLTVSQYFMAYSSFPPPLEEERRHWRRQEYADYLGRFRRRFGLDPHIRLNCAVETVSREADGSFAVETTQGGKARHIRTLVDFNTFLDSVAELVGCAPKLTDYLDDPPLLYKYKLICGTTIAATYRLRGPGADPEMARQVILRLPVVRDAVDLALLPWRSRVTSRSPRSQRSKRSSRGSSRRIRYSLD
jgi:hypothetical protein